MKIVVAPDKFKDCLTAAAVADAIARGLRSVDSDVVIDLCPMADGGEGTVAAMVAATNGRIITQRVTGPLASMKVDAPIGVLGDGETAVIEMAAASGLHLLRPDQRDPTRTTTYGTGELLLAAKQQEGIKRIILGIGGSATIDGGVGAAQAWGAKISLASGQVYSTDDRKITGGDLARLRSIVGTVQITDALQLPAPSGNGDSHVHEDRHEKKPRKRARPATPIPPVRLDTGSLEIIVACDVGNPLFGADGAVAIFGPQKGATPEQIEELDSGLRRLVERTALDDLANAPGAGAAGGLGFGMMAFFGATLRPGIDIIIDVTKLRDRLVGADLCITGEGKLDGQSLGGKTPIGVAHLCKELGIPCVALAGTIGPGAEAATEAGVTSFFSICDSPMPLEVAMKRAPELLESTAANLLRLWQRSQVPNGKSASAR
jgi:glycerate kinase